MLHMLHSVLFVQTVFMSDKQEYTCAYIVEV